MHKTQQILSDIVVFNKYAKYIDKLQRRETWDEIVSRYTDMMIKKYPVLKEEIKENKQLILDNKVLMSMRGAQFAGAAIEKNNSRVYNCAYMPIDHYKSFSEGMFLLLGGTGLGYSVQYSHIDKLPEIKKPKKSQKFIIEDSIEGWADAVKHLMKAYFGLRETKPRFDFNSIRSKGERLITAGGKAPGPEPLKRCLFNIELLLDEKENGSKLTPLESHDIMCRIADAVLAGGIRRAALISLFSADDEEMMSCKAGNWWESNPQRGRANNSAVLLRHRITETFFLDLWKKIELSNSGEPGIYLSNDRDMGTNPCFSYKTPLLTSEGYKQIGDLDGTNPDLINIKGEKVKGKVFKSGDKQIYEVHLNNKKVIECTKDHRFMLNTGEEKEAQNLTSEDRLMPFYNLNKRYSDYTNYGFIQGDGGLGRLKSEKHRRIEVYIGEKDRDIMPLFGVSESGKHYLSGYKDNLMYLGFSSEQLPNRVLPTTFNEWGKENKLDFLTGLWSANGSVIKNYRVAFKSTSIKLIKQLIKVLAQFDIESYYTTNKSKKVKFSNGEYLCKESYDLNIGKRESVLKFANLISFVHEYKKKDLEDLIKLKAPKVVKVVKMDIIKPVYDFTLNDDTHWGVIDGIIAHNCCEIALRPYSFCNLTEINGGNIKNQEDFNVRAKVAAFFGTLQAGITDFHYLRSIWQRTTEKDSLIGVGITGICNGLVLDMNLTEAANVVLKENERIANIINIPLAARVTTIKPSGTTSLKLGVSSGIHAWHSKYYIRNIQCAVGDDLYIYFTENHPELIKVMDLDPKSAVIGIPQKAPNNSILREDENALEMLTRVKRFYKEWVTVGHRQGSNTNNVSATVYIHKDNKYKPNPSYTGYISKKDMLDEWQAVGKWMWENRNSFNGLSCLPYNGGSYSDAPFQECTKKFYGEKLKYLTDINITNILEISDNTDLSNELACISGQCEII